MKQFYPKSKHLPLGFLRIPVTLQTFAPSHELFPETNGICYPSLGAGSGAGPEAMTKTFVLMTPAWRKATTRFFMTEGGAMPSCSPTTTKVGGSPAE
jgi:hypothetical protein